MPVYLDHNATTPLAESVLDAMLPFLQTHHGNPSSAHSAGRRARAAIDQARQAVAGMVGAHPSQVIFTAGGSSANNLALKGVCAAQPKPGKLWIGSTEHPSLTAAAKACAARGWQLHELAVDGEGRIDPISLPIAEISTGDLVSVMWANNETGVLQQIPHLARLVKGCGALFHTDAVQAAGKLPLDFQASGAHLMSLSAHKIGGPKGVGALIADRSVALEPLVHGGGQERGLMCGTENVAAIVGYGRAAEQVQERLDAMPGIRAMRDALEQELRKLPGVALFGAQAERLPNTVMFGVEGIEGETLLLLLDQAGYAVSSGSACGSARVDTSPVLRAMAIPKALAGSSIRVSLGPENKRADIDGFLRVLTNLTNARATQRAAI